MIILIDAYNLIKQMLKTTSVTDDEKRAFIKELKKYATKRSHNLVLVFDGGFESYITKENEGPVEIVYAGYKHSADDYIKDYLAKSKNKNLILVSSDIELKDKAKSLGIEAFNVDEFYSKVKESFQKEKIKLQGQIQKTSFTDDLELDELMLSDFSQIPFKDEVKVVVKNDNSLSKKDKKRDTILKKL